MAATQRVQYREVIDIRRIADRSADDYLGDLAAAFPGLDLLWGDGTDAGEADLFWCDLERSVGAGADDDLDLTALAGGPAGAAINFAEVRALFLHIIDGDLTMGGAPANVWTALLASGNVMQLKQGLDLRLICPTDGEFPVSAGDKVLRISNAGGATVKYRIAIVGCSA